MKDAQLLIIRTLWLWQACRKMPPEGAEQLFLPSRMRTRVLVLLRARFDREISDSVRADSIYSRQKGHTG